MAELKIEIPERWLNFIEEYYQVTGRDRAEDLIETVKTMIEMSMLDDDLLSAKEEVRLHEKYQLSDIKEISPLVRDEAAGIPRKVKPTTDDPMRKVAHLLANNQKFKRSFYQYLHSAETDSFIRALDELSPEERTVIQAAMSSA